MMNTFENKNLDETTISRYKNSLFCITYNKMVPLSKKEGR